jgi:hypothetical protein
MTGNCFVGGSYRGLFSLVRHSNNDGPVGIFWIIVSAVCHLRTLQITGYFGKEDKSTKSTLGANQLFIGGVLVDILQLLRYNTHSILEQVVSIFNKALSSKQIYRSLIR